MFVSSYRNTSGSLKERENVLPNFQKCFFNSIETWRACFLFQIQTPGREKGK